MERSVEKTDIIVRLEPIIGLIGTLIPMGSGLAVLGGEILNYSHNQLL